MIDELLNEARATYDDLSRCPCVCLKTMPKPPKNAGGVYVIYDKNDAVLYVGQAGDLYRRLHDDHLLGSGKSAFRRHLGKDPALNLHNKTDTSAWIEQNCCFKQIVIKGQKSDRLLIEHLLIYLLRPKYTG